MTITYPLAMPTSRVAAQLTFRPVEVVGASTSPFTMKRQGQRHQGQLWVVDCTLPPLTEDQAQDWIAWRLALKGSWGTFLLNDVSRRLPRGSALGSPVTQTAGSPLTNRVREELLYTTGWTANQTGLLLPGDWLQLGSGLDARLHKSLSRVDSDASGNAVLDLWPRLRADQADAVPLVLENAAGLFQMADNVMSWDVGEARIYGLSFTAVEVP